MSRKILAVIGGIGLVSAFILVFHTGISKIRNELDNSLGIGDDFMFGIFYVIIATSCLLYGWKEFVMRNFTRT